MSPDRIKQTLKETPFKPFSVHTGAGSSVDVLSPEFAFLYPGGRTLLVSVPKKPGAKDEIDFEEHRIDVFLITKLITPLRRSLKTKSKN